MVNITTLIVRNTAIPSRATGRLIAFPRRTSAVTSAAKRHPEQQYSAEVVVADDDSRECGCEFVKSKVAAFARRERRSQKPLESGKAQ
jgi:hypothetical protein